MLWIKSLLFAGITFASVALPTSAFAATKEKVLHRFCSRPSCVGGAWPNSLYMDKSGTLYGATYWGGTDECKWDPQDGGCGTVFRLSRGTDGKWTEKVLHSFHGPDGVEPNGPLIADAVGNLYGTTRAGGNRNRICEQGCGTVFELSPDANDHWTETVLYKFCTRSCPSDGMYPGAGLVMDASGSLYGTTYWGGSYGFGSVFQLTLSNDTWTQKTIYSFSDRGPDQPLSGLVLDPKGNLYGTTTTSAVYELMRGSNGQWTEKTLFTFNVDYGGDLSGLTFDANGNLYGAFPAKTPKCTPPGCGGIFELSQDSKGQWNETTLRSFYVRPKSSNNVIFDNSGNLYGTTNGGGADNFGIMYRLSPAPSGWKFKVLYSFQRSDRNGYEPIGPLVIDTSGTLYGATSLGGNAGCGVYGCGTVFEITP